MIIRLFLCNVTYPTLCCHQERGVLAEICGLGGERCVRRLPGETFQGYGMSEKTASSRWEADNRRSSLSWDQRDGCLEKFSFRFLPGAYCNADILASVYGEGAREQQACRIGSLLDNRSAERLFFTVAGYKNRAVALLHLCRELKKPHCFRVRGLYTHEQFRNQGLATRLLQLGVKCIFELYGGEEILSFVLPANRSSIAAHERACFYPVVLQTLQPERHLCFSISRKKQVAAEAGKISTDSPILVKV